MSVQAMAWALDRRQTGHLSPERRLVLVALADHADPDGRGAYPSAKTLAERLGVTVRAIRDGLAELREAGLIAYGDQALVAHYRGDRRPAVYDLAVEGRQTRLDDDGSIRSEPHRHDRHGVKTSAPREAVDNSARGEDDNTPLPVDNQPRGEVARRHGVKPASPKPSIEPKSDNPLPYQGDPQARTAAREARQAVPLEPFPPRRPPAGRPRPLGLTSPSCPNCGEHIGHTHRCRASAFDPASPAHRGNVGAWRERAERGEEVRMRAADDDLTEHDPCTGCGTTAAHRPLIADTGLCLRCVAAGGWEAVRDTPATQEDLA